MGKEKGGKEREGEGFRRWGGGGKEERAIKIDRGLRKGKEEERERKKEA